MLKKKETIRQFFTFNLVGAVNTIITYILYSSLVYFGIQYRLALVADYTLGAVISFVLNKTFTFKHEKKANIFMVMKMAISILIAFFINFGCLTLFVEKFHFNPYLGQILSLGIVVTFSFSAQKYLVFHQKTEKND